MNIKVLLLTAVVFASTQGGSLFAAKMNWKEIASTLKAAEKLSTLQKKEKELQVEVQKAQDSVNNYNRERVNKSLALVSKKFLLTIAGIPVVIAEIAPCAAVSGSGIIPAIIAACGPVVADIAAEVASRENGGYIDPMPTPTAASIIGDIYDTTVELIEVSKPSEGERQAVAQLNLLLVKQAENAQARADLNKQFPKAASIAKASNTKKSSKKAASKGGVSSPDLVGERGNRFRDRSGPDSGREYGTTVTAKPDGMGGFTFESKTGYFDK